MWRSVHARWMDTNAILKMEAAHSSNTLVSIYMPHGITFQNTVSLLFIAKFIMFIQIQNGPAQKTIPLCSPQFSGQYLYRICGMIKQHCNPPHFSHDKLGKILVFYSRKHGKSDQLQTIWTANICKTEAQDSSVSTVTRLYVRHLWNQGSIPSMGGYFFLLQSIQKNSGYLPAIRQA